MMTLLNKSLFILVLIALLVSGNSWAQGQDGPGRRGQHRGPPDAEMQVAHMTRMLELSDEQSAALLEVLQAAEEERNALHQQALKQVEPEICALQLGVKTELANILTAQQLERLEARSADRKQGGPGMRRRAAQDIDCSAYE